MWTENFQIFKLVLEKAEAPETKLPTSAGSMKKQEHFRKTSISALLTIPKTLTVCITNCGKFFKKWEYQTGHLTCLLRNLCVGKGATVRTGHGPTDSFQIGKGVLQGSILSPCLFNLYAEHIKRNAGWMKPRLELRMLGEISITSDMQMTPPLRQKSEEELKSLLMKWKRRMKKLS